MILLLVILLAAAPPTWDFVPEAKTSWLHVYHNGVDQGRAATGTVLTGWQMTFVPDTIAKRGFE